MKGAQSVAVTATLTDWYSRKISGVPIVFGASGSANDLISPQTLLTNCQGQARATFASTRSGMQTLTATRSATRASVDAEFSCAGSLAAAATH